MSSSVGTVQHYPMDLSHYGSTPNGGNLYRLVFAPSVRNLIGGTWADGVTEYRSRPTYRNLGNEWVLERWLSPQEYYGMTQEVYERTKIMKNGMFAGGPWQSEGHYFMCMDAPIRVEAIPSIGKLIEGIEFGRRNKSNERDQLNRQLAQLEVEQEQNNTDTLLLDKIRELRPSFGNRPTSFAGGVHSSKSKFDFNRPAPFKPGGGLKVLQEK